jgi:hypothetical protein
MAVVKVSATGPDLRQKSGQSGLRLKALALSAESGFNPALFREV